MAYNFKTKFRSLLECQKTSAKK